MVQEYDLIVAGGDPAGIAAVIFYYIQWLLTLTTKMV